MSNLFTIAAGRRSKWVAFAAWFIFVMIASGPANLPKKFADAESNESSSFLPGDAESTKALDLTKEIQGGDKISAVIVYYRSGGLTAADKGTIASDRASIAKATRTEPAMKDASPPSPPIFSKNGSGAIVTVQIATNGKGETITKPVNYLRDTYGDPGGGLQVKVTGGAGYSADAIKVFEGINGTLLLAAFALVFVLLILIYRSPIFLFIPLLAVAFAEVASRAFGYFLTEVGVTVNGQSSSILSILVLGAGTDYALLLVARYREELRRHEDKHEALKLALRTAGPAIFASGMTVIAALLCLTLAEVNGTAGLGPIGAMGVAVAMLSMLTFLPALLVITGRWAFWPFIPRYGGSGADETHGAWRKVGEAVAVRPRRVWIGAVAILGIFALGLLNFSTGLTQGNSYRDKVESVAGQELISKAFPGGANSPTDIIVPDRAKVPAVLAALERTEGIASVRVAQAAPPGTLLNATLTREPYSTEAFDLIPGIRKAARAAGGSATVVGGATAIEYDLRQASARDTRLIVPIALFVVFIILVLLLRAVLLPVLLVGTVILSFAAALGVGAVVFDVIFGFPGSDPSLPLFAFVFLVALGIDYNIFLMARVREEALKHGTRRGMLRGLAVTGGVITSAGIVLAGTFSVLAVLPLVFLTEIGFVIAFGVLLDTFLVRSVLVPALVFDIGPKVWWPSTLSKAHERRGREFHPEDHTAEEAEAPPEPVASP